MAVAVPLSVSLDMVVGYGNLRSLPASGHAALRELAVVALPEMKPALSLLKLLAKNCRVLLHVLPYATALALDQFLNRAVFRNDAASTFRGLSVGFCVRKIPFDKVCVCVVPFLLLRI